MPWRLLVCFFPIGLAACQAADPRPPSPGRPNVLLIMTDDQGWGDPGVHGNTVLDTPRLDALAAESGGMERFYVSPVCTPTRAALMTGRNSILTQAIDTYRGRAMMNPDEVTIAEVLRDAGYATGLFGKWHLGDSHPMRPIDQGFEEVLCHRGGGLAQPADHPDNERRYTNPILYHNDEPVQTEGFCMDVYTDAALAFMRAAVAGGQPFFAYLATNTPHGPWHDVPRELLAKYRARDLSPALDDMGQAERLAASFAMIENIDQNVGRLLDELDALGVADETIVVYLHDNGPAIRHFVGPLRGMKSEVFEGGIRSPFFVRWPGVVPAGLRRPEPAAHVDVWPTLVDATGVAAPDVADQDGRSLWPLLTDSATAWPDRLIHIQAHRGDRRVAEHNFAVIGPRYKLLRASGFGREQLPDEPAPLRLYDLLEDPGEEHDLSAAMPERVDAMLTAYRDWFAEATDYPAFGEPPPIVLDFAAAPTHELNRNDWRPRGGGYGPTGAWLIEIPETMEVSLFCQTRVEPEADTWTLIILLDGKAVMRQEFPSGREQLRERVMRKIPLLAGRHTLGIEIREGESLIPCDLLTVTRAPDWVANG